MRKEIKILWLDDVQPGEFSLITRRRKVEDILNEKGYKAHFTTMSNFDDAYRMLCTKERFDFFISDYNLDRDKTGLEYLKKIRDKNGYKQFVILYSNNEISEIKNKIIEYLNETSIDIFSNFTFFSLTRNEENEFRRAIDVILCRWDELNALRGLYMSENAELEHMLRERLEHKDNVKYSELIAQCRRDKVRPEDRRKKRSMFNNWFRLAEERNALAHVEEQYSSEEGYFLVGTGYDEKPFLLSEKYLDTYRKKLIEDVEEIRTFLNGIALKKK
ncbi:hypothetical protein [Lactococcus lactis]|jgi:hypothetical protein|uniref:hypothetical protein n=1 Tax=Lactococcus lactis TaxID=1358 RepID=UPI002054DD97|nr:hypothetical protein [Lactococcus lactis]BDH80629.1 hypothetical protein LLL8_02860 [Lactococcus lactis]